MTQVGRLLGSGMVADVHVYGDRALKLYHQGRGKAAAFTEAAILGIIEAHGLPAPHVYEAGNYDGRWGLVMDRVDGETLGHRALAEPAMAPAALEEVVRLQLMLHGVVETRLRPLRARLATNIAHTPLLAAADKDRLLAALGGLPDGDRICHGDFHPLNVIGEPGQTTIIDWLDATAGPPAADACRSYLLLRLAAAEFAEPYLDLFARRSGIGRASILAWLPCVAAARLAEGVAQDEAQLLVLAGAQ